jgi:predicted AlkP superfamily pyrophosphatase or phosphodiesterase
MNRTLVLNVVGLTEKLLGPDTPHLQTLARAGAARPLETITPAVTCAVQSTFLTGEMPARHGIVGNGWYFRDLSEIWFWRQSNRLVGGEKLWDAARARDPAFTCAQLFWWYNMYSSADVSVTPRPMYPADGRKIPDVYTSPPELRHRLTEKLGPFPLFNFWGPNASIASSDWIARCARVVEREHRPTLTLVYLPHLDYCLQKFGPGSPEIRPRLREVDSVCGDLIRSAGEDVQVIVLSEYGVMEVSRPVHINRALREAGLLAVRDELGRELLDPGASRAFAVADHQIAHVYVADPGDVEEVSRIVGSLAGVERVLDREGKREYRIDHERAGELVALAERDSWFSYYYWMDDARAPDFARMVDIHRKPGYDPVELFLDPAIRIPMASVGWRLFKQRLGLRVLMDVIPLDADLVRGSHGRLTRSAEEGPILISSRPGLLPEGSVRAEAVKGLILEHIFDRVAGDSV